MSTNILSLDRAIQNTILWLNDVQDELQWNDRNKVYRATKAVLQSIRDRLPIEELVHFSANLPMVMKGMLFDNLDLANDKSLQMKTVEDFYARIQDYYDSKGRDVVDAEQAAKGVITAIFTRIGAGEMQKVSDNMPLKLKPFFQQETGTEPIMIADAEELRASQSYD